MLRMRLARMGVTYKIPHYNVPVYDLFVACSGVKVLFYLPSSSNHTTREKQVRLICTCNAQSGL